MFNSAAASVPCPLHRSWDQNLWLRGVWTEHVQSNPPPTPVTQNELHFFDKQPPNIKMCSILISSKAEKPFLNVLLTNAAKTTTAPLSPPSQTPAPPLEVLSHRDNTLSSRLRHDMMGTYFGFTLTPALSRPILSVHAFLPTAIRTWGPEWVRKADPIRAGV